MKDLRDLVSCHKCLQKDRTVAPPSRNSTRLQKTLFSEDFSAREEH